MAQFELGRQYSDGTIVQRNVAEALHWLTSAAKAGHPTADLLMGKILLKESHGDSHAAEALAHFERSAVSGNAEAAALLGMAFAQGQMAERDLSKAEHWLKLAAKSGDPQSQFLLGNLYLNEVNKPQEAFTWNNLAGKVSQPNAQYNVALQLHHGLGTPQNIDLAMQ